MLTPAEVYSKIKHAQISGEVILIPPVTRFLFG